MRNKTLRKIFSWWGILSILLVTGLGLFIAVPQPAHAQVPNIPLTAVPIFGEGGKIDAVGKVVDDQTANIHEIIRAGTIAAMNSAFQSFSDKLIQSMENRFGIESTLYYQAALIESKYLVQSIRKKYGEDAFEECVDDVNCVTSFFQVLPVNSILDRQQARLLGASQRIRGNDLRQLVIGATTQYTSSVACGGVDNKAVDNTAQFLAGVNAGTTPEQIDPTGGAEFYEQMSRLGHPLSSPDVWKLQFQDMAAQSEGEARQAAALEAVSPGLKAPQEIRNGRLSTTRSLSLISIGEENAQNALFNIATKGADSIYDSSSFRAFIFSLLADFGSRIFGQLLGGLFGDAAGLLGESISEQVEEQAQNAGRIIATRVVTSFGMALYDRISQQIFQGEVLAESTGCRNPSTFGGYSEADTTFDLSDVDLDIDAYERGENGPGGGPGGGPGPVGAFLSLIPDSVPPGSTVAIFWSAGQVEDDSTVTLAGGKYGGGQEVPALGSDNDTVSQNTTYTLSVDGVQLETATVTVIQGGSGDLVDCDEIGCRAGDENPPPFDINNAVFLHGNNNEVADWDETATISSVSVQPGQVCVNYDKANVWPPDDTKGAEVVGHPWVLAAIDGVWYAGTFEFFRPNQFCKALESNPPQLTISDSIGPHVEKSPLNFWQPAQGERVGFMVSGLVRDPSQPRNAEERSQVFFIDWPLSD